MIDHDDAFLDSVAVLALGALPATEAATVAAHVAGCAPCRREYDDLREAADAVGFSAELAPAELDELTSARMKSRIMRTIAGEAMSPTQAPAPALPASVKSVAVAPSRPWLAYGALAAALTIAAVEAVVLAGFGNARADDAHRIAALQAQTQSQASNLALALSPGSKRFAAGNGTVIESRGQVLLAFTGLPLAPPGKVYQAWTFAHGSNRPVPSITFVANPSGVTVLRLPAEAAAISAVAVTIEPPGGSKAPTSKPTFVRSLS